MVDSKFNVWLLEVNSNPCWEESSYLLEKLVPRAINDALKLTVDQVFVQRKGMQGCDRQDLNCFSLPGYADDENIWRYLSTLQTKFDLQNKPGKDPKNCNESVNKTQVPLSGAGECESEVK